MKQVTYSHFTALDMRAGKIIRAEDFPKARLPAYKLWIDFGDIGIKKSSARITKLYQKEDLPGRFIIAVVNFPPKQVADFISEVLVLVIVLKNDEVSLLNIDHDVLPGARIS